MPTQKCSPIDVVTSGQGDTPSKIETKNSNCHGNTVQNVTIFLARVASIRNNAV